MHRICKKSCEHVAEPSPLSELLFSKIFWPATRERKCWLDVGFDVEIVVGWFRDAAPISFLPRSSRCVRFRPPVSNATSLRDPTPSYIVRYGLLVVAGVKIAYLHLSRTIGRWWSNCLMLSSGKSVISRGQQDHLRGCLDLLRCSLNLGTPVGWGRSVREGTGKYS